jgi:hypothetical protein
MLSLLLASAVEEAGNDAELVTSTEVDASPEVVSATEVVVVDISDIQGLPLAVGTEFVVLSGPQLHVTLGGLSVVAPSLSRKKNSSSSLEQQFLRPSSSQHIDPSAHILTRGKGPYSSRILYVNMGST